MQTGFQGSKVQTGNVRYLGEEFMTLTSERGMYQRLTYKVINSSGGLGAFTVRKIDRTRVPLAR